MSVFPQFPQWTWMSRAAVELIRCLTLFLLQCDKFIFSSSTTFRLVCDKAGPSVALHRSFQPPLASSSPSQPLWPSPAVSAASALPHPSSTFACYYCAHQFWWHFHFREFRFLDISLNPVMNKSSVTYPYNKISPDNEGTVYYSD